MILLSVLILSCSLLSTKALDCTPNLPSCSDDADIAQIKCPGGDCTLECPDGECSKDLKLLLLGENPIQAINAEECQEKCQLHANSITDKADKCQFYRWQNEHDNIFHCSLQTMCEADPTCGGSIYCITGEIGCTDDHPDKECPLKKATWENDKFHVICYSGEDITDINIYEADKTVPAGTICQTVRMCAEWNERDAVEAPEIPGSYKRKLAVRCDGLTGNWSALEKTGSAEKSAAMIAVDTIVEQTCCVKDEPDTPHPTDGCNCKDLDSTTDPWGDLICENSLAGNKITDPNSCMLLCDNHLTKSFRCRLGYDDGEKKWLDDNDETEVKDVKCE